MSNRAGRCLVCAFALLVCLTGRLYGVERTRLIGDFEKRQDLRAWEISGRAGLSKRHVTHGEYSARIRLPAADWPGLATRNPPGDWSGFDALAFEIYSESARAHPFTLRIDDASSTGYGSRYNEAFALRPGANRFEIPLTGLRTSDKRRIIDTRRITRFAIFLSRPQEPVTLYVDWVRLVKRLSIADVPGFMLFDFGPANSPVWPGAKRVTPDTVYGGDNACGFTRSGANCRDRHHPDELTGDWVEALYPFVVKVKPGRYVVAVADEDAGYWEWYPHCLERAIYINSVKVWEEKLSVDEWLAKRYLARIKEEYLPGDDLYSRCVAKRFAFKRFVLDAPGGLLQIRFEPTGLQRTVISALIVFPEKEKSLGDRFFGELSRARRSSFERRFVTSPPKPPRLPSAGGKSFVVFSRPHDVPLYPYGYPAPGEVNRAPRLTVARGERAHFTFSILPLKDLGLWRPALLGCSGEGDRRLGAEHFVLRHVLYKAKRIAASSGTYESRPELLVPGEAPMRKGVVRRFWVTCRVGDAAADGLYRGRIQMTSGERAVAEVPFELEILPFRLAPVEGIQLGMFWYPLPFYRWFESTADLYWRQVATQLADMREHGMTTVCASAPVNDLARIGALYRAAGFPSPIYVDASHVTMADTPGGAKNFRYGLARRADVFAHQGVATVLNLLDEPTNVGGIGLERAEARLRAAAPLRVTLAGALNHPRDESLMKHLDIPLVNNGMSIGPRLIEMARSMDKPHARESDINASYPSPEGLLNAAWWEVVATGVNDLAYWQALHRLVERFGASHSTDARALAIQGKLLLSEIDAAIPISLDEARKAPPGTASRFRRRIGELLAEFAADPLARDVR